jgi:hypothetical protein
MKMMGLVFLFTCLISARVEAQFFGQQAKKTKLMMEQIADLQIYLNRLKSACRIAEKGLQMAQELKNVTWNLHSAYFYSLKEVNPVIAADPKGKAIYGLYQGLVMVFQKEVDWQQRGNLLDRQEFVHLQRVYTNLLTDSQRDLDALVQVLTNGKLQLSDQQRTERLNKVYNRMRDKQAFARYFTSQCRKLALGRQQVLQENEQVKQLYGIN